MTEIYTSIIIGVIGVVVGYLISSIQGRKFRKEAIQLLRPFEVISLRDEFHLTHLLARQICDARFHPDVIIATTPGGAMIGEWLSRRFLGDKSKPIPLCNVWVEVERDSEGRHLHPPKAITLLETSFPEANSILIVNDISRNGRTIEAVFNLVEENFKNSTIKMAVLFLSEDAGPPYPDFFVDKPPRRVNFEWKS